ncbi:Protein kinase-like domain superfamily, partial [Arabidopsis thaliana x Arabidopsis arenosa]
VLSLVLAQDGDEFVYHDFSQADLHLDGMATIDDGRLHLTNNTNKSTGHAFWKIPMNFTTSPPSSLSFSTEFVFAIFPLLGDGQGMAFVVSPSMDLRYSGDATSYLGLFNRKNDNNTENHILAVELDTNPSTDAEVSDNHVGIDINSIISVDSANASYFSYTEGKNISFRLASEKSILVWIDYDGIEKLLTVTVAPVPIRKPVSPYLSSSIKPRMPLLSRSINISEIFNGTMFVGFSGSTGTVKSDQYILGWSFKKGGNAESLDLSMILDPPSRPPPPSPPKDTNKYKLILGATIPSIAFLMILGGTVYMYKRKKYAEVLEQWEKEYIPQRYSFKSLYNATKGFKENQLLGAGGFGKVYKGELPSGTQIAVKRVYHDAEQGMKQYVAEIASMGRLRHKNLVQLLGYCRRKGELLLVYDYMPNGSLDDYLFNRNKLKYLTWSQRVNIIKGVASALLYLHEDWEQVVLHRDIKASNILLDADLNGRLGDFGLARFHNRGENLEATHVVGTIGYMAPELTAMGVATTKTDVYAFGSFILEVVCGRRPVEPDRPPEQMLLLKWVATCGKRDTLMDVVDSKLGDFKAEESKLLLKLGMLCSLSNPETRPSMRHIIQYLEGNASVPNISFDTAGFAIPNISTETEGIFHLLSTIVILFPAVFHSNYDKVEAAIASKIFSTKTSSNLLVEETRGTKAIQRLAPLGKYSPLPLVGQNEGGTLNKSKEMFIAIIEDKALLNHYNLTQMHGCRPEKCRGDLMQYLVKNRRLLVELFFRLAVKKRTIQLIQELRQRILLLRWESLTVTRASLTLRHWKLFSP